MPQGPGAAVLERPPASFGAIPVLPLLTGLGHGLLALFVFFICFTFLRPSPYDFVALPTVALWLCLGIRLYRGALPGVGLLVAYHLALLVALLPHLGEALPLEWTLQAFYLMVTAVFFAMLFSDDTERRVTLALNAYVASCLFAAGAGIASYFDLFGGVLFKMDGRAAGVFEDPNVLGSFLVPGALYLAHGLVLGHSRRRLLAAGALALIMAAIFLSFSRGSWAAAAVAFPTMIALAWRTSGPAVRRRIVALGALAALGGVLLLGALLSVEGVAERFENRAQLTHSYDEGVTGRFGNQMRSVPMLIEEPLGFGPLRFRRHFGLEPHNSYIGAFANGGWLGGFAFLALVAATTFVGFRLCLTPSPYRHLAQMAWPGLFIFFLQAVQIDVDKWRHVYLLLGIVWGLEAARLRWRAAQARAG
ncbi:MAG TPA: O-antigen ligase family protein [Beijerinckiaceae bacterium]|nr:O-antigen ligase family protein [Beijerinckiaceae bacterium]